MQNYGGVEGIFVFYGGKGYRFRVVDIAPYGLPNRAL